MTVKADDIDGIHCCDVLESPNRQGDLLLV